MAKRSFSSSLQGMKFMQRGRLREEVEAKKEEEEKNEEHWIASAAGKSTARCVVIMEGDPKPGALIGRMSFQNFNPSIDKLQEEIEARKTQAKSKAAGYTENQHKRGTGNEEQVKAESSKSAENTQVEDSSSRKKAKTEADEHKVRSASNHQQGQKVSQNRFDAIRVRPGFIGARPGFRKPPKF